MLPRIHNLFLGGLLTAILAAGFSWLLTSEKSPLAEYLLWHPQIRNSWGLINFPSYLAGAMIAGNPHNISEPVAWMVFFLQWMITGILLIVILSSLLTKKSPQ